MKQIMVYCNNEIRDDVIKIINQYEVGGYLEVGEAYGCIPKRKDQLEGKDLTWPASMFIAFDEDKKIKAIFEDLKRLVDRCETKPCLRLVVLDIAEFF